MPGADCRFQAGAWIRPLVAALGLARQIVGVTFLHSRAEFERSQLKSLRTPMSYCSMVRLGTLGRARKASLAHIACPGARRALGLSAPDEEYLSGRRYFSLGLYENLARARETAAEVSLMPETIHGVSVQPLATCAAAPDVVLCICDPNQAMRMVQGYIHGQGPLQAMGSLGMQGVCAELTVRPFLTGKPNVSLLCSNTRFSCAWGDHELGIAMPFSVFPKVVEGVLGSLNAAESDRAKEAIAARAAASGVDISVRPGEAYYQRPRQTPIPSSSNGRSGS